MHVENDEYGGQTLAESIAHVRTIAALAAAALFTLAIGNPVKL
ncbi:hypothetical protein [Myxacorys almedinensis]|nr:hypothetical protein [Myxacorys almedinensis]